MFVVSALGAILFFGGWNGPIPVFDIIGWSYLSGESWRLTGYLANLAGCGNFILKTVVGVTLMMWVRWTLPRLRIDQVITTCLKYCVPLAAVGFAGAVLWTAAGVPFLNDLPGLSNRRSAIRENWVEQTMPAADVTTSMSEEPRTVAARSEFSVFRFQFSVADGRIRTNADVSEQRTTDNGQRTAAPRIEPVPDGLRTGTVENGEMR